MRGGTVENLFGTLDMGTDKVSLSTEATPPAVGHVVVLQDLSVIVDLSLVVALGLVLLAHSLAVVLDGTALFLVPLGVLGRLTSSHLAVVLRDLTLGDVTLGTGEDTALQDDQQAKEQW